MTAFGIGAFWGLAAALLIALAALIGVWAERKIAGRIQLRFGPQEAGPVGLLQTLADTVKLVLKEDVTPNYADVAVFRAMPFLALDDRGSFVVIPIGRVGTFRHLRWGAVLPRGAGAECTGHHWLAGRHAYAPSAVCARRRNDVRAPAGSVGPAVCSPDAADRRSRRMAPWWLPCVWALVYFISSIAELNGDRSTFRAESGSSPATSPTTRVSMGHLHDGHTADSPRRPFGAAVFFSGGLGYEPFAVSSSSLRCR
jgi:hypothetical protein